MDRHRIARTHLVLALSLTLLLTSTPGGTALISTDDEQTCFPGLIVDDDRIEVRVNYVCAFGSWTTDRLQCNGDACTLWAVVKGGGSGVTGGIATGKGPICTFSAGNSCYGTDSLSLIGLGCVKGGQVTTPAASVTATNLGGSATHPIPPTSFTC